MPASASNAGFPASAPLQPGDGIVLRPARDDDGPAIGTLLAAVFAEYPGCVFVESEFPELAAPASTFAAGGGCLWVAEASAEGSVIGSFGILKSPEPSRFTLHKVYLGAATRGRGLARRMLAQAEAFARDQGAHELLLWTDTRFRDGHRFYERNGFARLPVVRFLGDASDSWEFAYRRRLAAEPGKDA